ncbi:hypothetical protein [Clostridium disporicum]|uniref:Uncharacterized protein n=1 Tax=Clostridium disporicum TaxID=84024 RepID=A0A174AJ25_9CLOT|nr:hypothetical protein [Clostridium disporicum]CUN87525.1 Uncharacterised protein [Clostridium disporicum]
MKMNKKEEKLCRFLVTNKIIDEDLTLDFDEGILIYKNFEWDLNSKYTEVEVNEYEEEYEELLVEDCDGYKLKIYWDGTIEVETPGDETELEELRRENSELLYKIEMLEKANKDLANIIKNKSETDIAEKDDVIKRFLKSYSIGDLDEAIEHFKSIQDYAKLCNKVYLNTMLTGVR